MKRTANIFSSIFLSILIVWIGGGIALLHCAHTGMTELMAFNQESSGECCMEDPACENKPCCESHEGQSFSCKPMPGCIDVEVLKLSPTTRSSVSSFDFTQVPVLVPLCNFVDNVEPMAAAVGRVAWIARNVWHEPPRGYLALLRVLRL